MYQDRGQLRSRDMYSPLRESERNNSMATRLAWFLLCLGWSNFVSPAPGISRLNQVIGHVWDTSPAATQPSLKTKVCRTLVGDRRDMLPVRYFVTVELHAAHNTDTVEVNAGGSLIDRVNVQFDR